MKKLQGTTKTRGSSKFFKAAADGGNETALITYHENGEVKTAVFRGDGCKDRAAARMQELRAQGAQVISYTAGGTL